MDIRVIAVVPQLQEEPNFGGPSGTNGIMPSVIVMTLNGPVRTAYFGGPKKGGAAPSATGFMTPSGSRGATTVSAPRIKTQLFI